MTPAEWNTILRQAEQNKHFLDQREAAGNALIGKPAPSFPEAADQWLNSKPLKWADLKGKPVILDFWAEWCGPCRNDLPQAEKIFEDSPKSGIAIVGVHPPGSEMPAIQKVMKQFQMQYPICIDSPPPEGSQTWGLLYHQYGVMGIPESFLVDPEGKIVAHGSLGQMLAKARELVGEVEAK